jgi:hypothetical protein
MTEIGGIPKVKPGRGLSSTKPEGAERYMREHTPSSRFECPKHGEKFNYCEECLFGSEAAEHKEPPPEAERYMREHPCKPQCVTLGDNTFHRGDCPNVPAAAPAIPPVTAKPESVKSVAKRHGFAPVSEQQQDAAFRRETRTAIPPVTAPWCEEGDHPYFAISNGPAEYKCIICYLTEESDRDADRIAELEGALVEHHAMAISEDQAYQGSDLYVRTVTALATPSGERGVR